VRVTRTGAAASTWVRGGWSGSGTVGSGNAEVFAHTSGVRGRAGKARHTGPQAGLTARPLYLAASAVRREHRQRHSAARISKRKWQRHAAKACCTCGVANHRGHATVRRQCDDHKLQRVGGAPARGADVEPAMREGAATQAETHTHPQPCRRRWCVWHGCGAMAARRRQLGGAPRACVHGCTAHPSSARTASRYMQLQGGGS
jgi:hypothetical protein